MDCGAPWSEEALAAAVEHGPQKGALSEEAIQLVHDDVEYQVKAVFAEIYFWDDLKGDHPSNLKISLVTVIPQQDRRGRITLDLLFPVYQRAARGRRRQIRKIRQEAVNKFLVGLAPEKAVKQLGKILPLLFEYLLETPTATPVLFSKINLSDGFWRMKVTEDQKWNFSYVMLDKEGERGWY